MDLSLLKNSANTAAATDAKASSSSRAEASSGTPPKSDKFSSMLETPQEQAPANAAATTAKSSNTMAQNQPRANLAGTRSYEQPDYSNSSVAAEVVAPSPSQNGHTQQAAMDQTLFDAMASDNSNDSGLLQQPSTSLGDTLQAGMDPALIQAQAAVAKANGGVPVKIQAILDFIFKSDGLSEKAPILASLKAQAKTPLLDLSTMADNPFFKQLESSPNPDEILKKAVPVGELLSQLQVSPKLLMALGSAGFDLRAKVTPEQLMKAVGITPDRLVSAINMASRATPTGLHELTLAQNNEKEHVVKETPTTQSHAEPTSQPATQPIPTQHKAQPTPQPNTPDVTPKSHLVSTSAKTVAADPYEALGAQQSENKTTISFASSDTPEDTANLAILALRDGNQPPNHSPMAQGAALKTDTMLQPQRPGALREGTLDALLRSQFSNELSVEASPEEAAQVDGEIMGASQSTIPGFQAQTLATKQAGTPASFNFDQTMAMQEMPISSSTQNWENKDDQFMGESEDREPIEFDEPISSDITGTDFALQEGQQQQHGASRIEQKPDVSAKEPMNESHFAEKAKEIFDKAEMLVKDGGGSMKIDMSSEELGKLDLAVDVQGDKVDLRIIASSEKVKEILTQDIPKLREALNNQNLELKNVEISQQGMSGWSFNQQSSERSFERNMKQDASSGTRGIDSMRAFTARPRTYANPVHHSGRIQVLV